MWYNRGVIVPLRLEMMMELLGKFLYLLVVLFFLLSLVFLGGVLFFAIVYLPATVIELVSEFRYKSLKLRNRKIIYGILGVIIEIALAILATLHSLRLAFIFITPIAIVWIFCIACSLHNDWRIFKMSTTESVAPLFVTSLSVALVLTVGTWVLTEPYSVTEKEIHPLDGQYSYSLGATISDDAMETVDIVHLSGDSDEEPHIEVYTTYNTTRDRLSGSITVMDSRKVSERRIVIYLK